MKNWESTHERKKKKKIKLRGKEKEERRLKEKYTWKVGKKKLKKRKWKGW